MRFRSIAVAAASLLLLIGLPGTRAASISRVVKRSFFDGGEITPFVDALPVPARIVIPKGAPAQLTIPMTELKMKYHRDLPETTVWGYKGSSPGPTIEVESGTKLTVRWQHRLPSKHLFPREEGSMPGMPGMSMPAVRVVTHLHGAVVSQPETKSKTRNNDGWPDAYLTKGQEQQAEYPNQQTARTLWYHDHAMGATARNVYAGLAGLYLIHDDFERSLNLPSGDYDIPLFLQSRGFNDDGSLFYPESGFLEFYGNSIAVNGKVWPYLAVEPRRYRFRIVNGSNARTVDLKLLGLDDGAAGPAFHQIGSDGGFLAAPVTLNDPADANARRLELAPSERADIVIDFSGYAGKELLLHNDSLTDPGEGEVEIPAVMLFRVGTEVHSADTSQIPTSFKPIPKLSESSATTTRQITLGQRLMPDGTPMLTLNDKLWHDPIEEKPVLGTTEIWNVVNTLKDIHPFHIHLITFQVIDRTPFDVNEFAKTGKVVFTGVPKPPEANEAGWKDTVRSYPATITRLIMKFEPFTGYYVYHCHILEHEDMDMMRPFQVVAP